MSSVNEKLEKLYLKAVENNDVRTGLDVVYAMISMTDRANDLTKTKGEEK